MKTLQLHALTSDEICKIFPQSYYTKYASHLKILEFEKKLVQQQDKKSHVNFIQRGNRQKRIKTAMPKQVTQRNRGSKFDSYYEAIVRNREQLKRMNKYNSILGMKLKTSPQRRNILRSLYKNGKELEDDVFLKMKAIEDMEFQRKQKEKHQAREQIQKRLLCKFVKNSRSYSAFQRKVSDMELESKVNPETLQTERDAQQKNLHIPIKRICHNYSQTNILTQQKPKTSKLSNISNSVDTKNKRMSKSSNNMKLSSTKRKFLKWNKVKGSSEKKDLILQTSRIKEHVRSMSILKRFDIILQKRESIKNLQQL